MQKKTIQMSNDAFSCENVLFEDHNNSTFSFLGYPPKTSFSGQEGVEGRISCTNFEVNNVETEWRFGSSFSSYDAIQSL